MYVLVREALDESARAAPLDDEAFLDELVDSLLNRDAADTILLTHLALQSQLLPRLINARLYLAAQFIRYFLIFDHKTTPLHIQILLRTRRALPVSV